jgi:hypothetical protein
VPTFNLLQVSNFAYDVIQLLFLVQSITVMIDAVDEQANLCQFKTDSRGVVIRKLQSNTIN